MPHVVATVPGQPVPQPRPRVTTRGGFGRAYVPATHPIHAWREAVRQAYDGPQFGNAVSVHLEFCFRRPPSHLKRNDELTAAGRKQPYPKPDVDNLAKAVLDALNGVAWVDDSQVVELRTAKSWIDGDAHCIVSVFSGENE